VTISRGDDGVVLYQGQQTEFGSYEIHVSTAQSGSGAYECDDGEGTELDSWFLLPVMD
jgi:hypothetical protein